MKWSNREEGISLKLNPTRSKNVQFTLESPLVTSDSPERVFLDKQTKKEVLSSNEKKKPFTYKLSPFSEPECQSNQF